MCSVLVSFFFFHLIRLFLTWIFISCVWFFFCFYVWFVNLKSLFCTKYNPRHKCVFFFLSFVFCLFVIWMVNAVLNGWLCVSIPWKVKTTTLLILNTIYTLFLSPLNTMSTIQFFFFNFSWFFVLFCFCFSLFLSLFLCLFFSVSNSKPNLLLTFWSPHFIESSEIENRPKRKQQKIIHSHTHTNTHSHVPQNISLKTIRSAPLCVHKNKSSNNSFVAVVVVVYSFSSIIIIINQKKRTQFVAI